MTGKLKVAKGRLNRDENYKIIDAVYSASDGGKADMSRDKERSKLVKSRRAKLKNRLVEPYGPAPE